MQNEPTDFRNRLLDAQQMTPELREAYRKEVDAIVHHRLTPRTRLLAIGGLLLAVAFTAVGLRSLLFFRAAPATYGVWIAYTVASAFIALWTGWALLRGAFPWRSYFQAMESLPLAGAVIAVLTLLGGLRAPADPASTFWAVFALVFLVVCAAMSIHHRIAAAQLAAREQMIRIESRIVDLADRLAK